ncbi:Bug family tripartite tricarboxylate transporter substrate binding protein [Humitalea sp. 24SJ18S-53]|uniref:Bug family tripartite tricarboxylate transporter substrate binding protein n=1 Tax=Humitalea sp. 24SJ18S-53 TaxID=3422307 RepID=UPI003D670329
MSRLKDSMGHTALSRRAMLAAPAVALAVPAMTLTVPAAAQSWQPNRPLRMVVPFVPGGSTDVGARIVSERMASVLGRPIQVDNRGGSGGNLGGAEVARSAPDGHTMLMGVTGLLCTNPILYANMGFDPGKDLAPVGLTYVSDLVLVVTNSMPVQTLAEFVALAKSQPGALTYGSSGHGATTHTSAALFCLAAGIDAQHAPYRGSGAAMNDLLSGTLPFMMVQVAGAAPQILDGRVRALAVTGSQRHPLLPNVPTLAEGGVAGAEATSWGAIMVPSATPAAAIATLSGALRESLADPAVQRRMAAAGVDAAWLDPEATGAFIRDEATKWQRVVREARIKID